jgi:hypothetical protein
MEIHVFARAFREPVGDLAMCDVWRIERHELSEVGEHACRLLGSEDFPDQREWKNTVWICQAILEFQDLQDVRLPERGRFTQQNYLFFEGIAVLREAILAGLNGCLHASFAALRSALELVTFHYWWKEKLRFAEDYQRLYLWLDGEKDSPPFRGVIDETFRAFEVPGIAIKKKDFENIYSRLCSYSHKPLIKEAVTTIRGTNLNVPNDPQSRYWVGLVRLTVRAILDVAVNNSPISLFPVALHRKFGFSPPVGVFFDQSNFLPLRKALGPDEINALRSHYEKRDPPLSQLEWFDSLPELDEQSIFDTWQQEEEMEDGDQPLEDRVSRRYATIKAKSRAFHIAFSHGLEGPMLPDAKPMVERILRSGK